MNDPVGTIWMAPILLLPILIYFTSDDPETQLFQPIKYFDYDDRIEGQKRLDEYLKRKRLEKLIQQTEDEKNLPPFSCMGA